MCSAPVGIWPSDWDLLFQAVRGRLTQLVAHAATHETRTEVLECVEALAQLGFHLTAERARHHDQTLQLLAARTALAKARIEIAGNPSSERRTHRMDLHGGLTSLPNRSFLVQWLDHALVKADRLPQPLAVFHLDLGGFKRINGTHGHGVGDELLRIVASRLARAVRAEDVVSRLGGDEFACAMTPIPGRSQLGKLARKLFDSVSAPIRIGPHQLAMRPSVGIAMCPAQGATTERLLRNAEAAMCHAKRHGCGFAFFDEAGGGATCVPAALRELVGR